MVGGLASAGDTSCADHMIAWRTRNGLKLDHLAGVGGVSGDPMRPITSFSTSGAKRPERRRLRPSQVPHDGDQTKLPPVIQ